MKPIFKIIGDYTRQKRIAAGLSQRQVAQKLGYNNAQFVSNVERGLCNYPLRNLKKLEKLIGLDLVHTRDLLVIEYGANIARVFFPEPKKPKAAKKPQVKAATKRAVLEPQLFQV